MEMKLPQPESFADTLARGQIGESLCSQWLVSRGSCVLPVYETELATGKGPRFFTPQGALVAPDMFVLPAMIWAEAKHKTVFSWHRKTERWVTGIDIKHYRDYLKVEARSGKAVWLLFLHACGQPDARDIEKGCPPAYPTGLFGGRLKTLAGQENHRHRGGGPSGMVYWAAPPLQKLATLEELNRARSAA